MSSSLGFQPPRSIMVIDLTASDDEIAANTMGKSNHGLPAMSGANRVGAIGQNYSDSILQRCLQYESSGSNSSQKRQALSPRQMGNKRRKIEDENPAASRARNIQKPALSSTNLILPAPNASRQTKTIITGLSRAVSSQVKSSGGLSPRISSQGQIQKIKRPANYSSPYASGDDEIRAMAKAQLASLRKIGRSNSEHNNKRVSSLSATPEMIVLEDEVFDRGRSKEDNNKPRPPTVSPSTSYSNDPEQISPPDEPKHTSTTTPESEESLNRQRRSTRAVQSYDLVRRRRSRKSIVINEAIDPTAKPLPQNPPKPEPQYPQTRRPAQIRQQEAIDEVSQQIRSELQDHLRKTPREEVNLPSAHFPPVREYDKKREIHRPNTTDNETHPTGGLFSICLRDQNRSKGQQMNISSTFPLLRQRAIDGLTPRRLRRGELSFKSMTTNTLEDSLVRRSEWTDSSGDIVSISWTSEDTFVCGALAHYDPHNQQYNKPGNLLFGSISRDEIRAFPDHRIIRPRIVESANAENASDAMRQSQAPWLYASVVSTGYYEPIRHYQSGGYIFTSSFDHTVKVWSRDSSTIDLRATWKHDGKVNFVVTSAHHSRVATASELSTDAVRVYDLNEADIAGSVYQLYGGNKSEQQAGDTRKWAYQPATIQWGRAFQVQDLLLIGYSPRSETGEDTDIPDDKKNTGEVCVWNTRSRERLNIFGAHSQNVFEVLWHPSQPVFIAALSPSGNFDSERTKTQVKVYCLNESNIFVALKSLDCPAMDINELTLRPNCRTKFYVTASCTDGNTYVWDTAGDDSPIHILAHSKSLDTPRHDLPLELGDSGVKFVSWGQSRERFYTGSSDGKVKCWDITAPPGQAYLRTLLSVPGGISSGSFSQDFSKLLIGDATGKVYLLGRDDSDIEAIKPPTTTNMLQKSRLLQGGILSSAIIKRPKVIIPHLEPNPPIGFEVAEEESVLTLSQRLLDTQQLQLYRGLNLSLGQEVYQGIKYHETGLFRLDAHIDNDASQSLLPEFLSKQQFNLCRQLEDLSISQLPEVSSSDPQLHLLNQAEHLNPLQPTPEMIQELELEHIEWECNDFLYDYIPHSDFPTKKLFKRKNRDSQKGIRTSSSIVSASVVRDNPNFFYEK